MSIFGREILEIINIECVILSFTAKTNQKKKQKKKKQKKKQKKNPSVTGEVYCFPRRQLFFIFGSHCTS